MAVTGAPRNYHKKHKFRIEVGGVTSAKFQSCSELSAEIATIEQWEGGSDLADKSPGRTTIPDITLMRGATTDLDLWNWFKLVSDMVANGGVVLPEYEKDLDIVALDRDNSTKMRWRTFRVWPNKFVAGDWDNTVDENVIESVTLVINRFAPVIRS